MQRTSASLHIWRPLRCLQPYLFQCVDIGATPIGRNCYHQSQLLSTPPLLKSYSTVAQNLPPLPVPPLQKTLDKYLSSVRPLVTDNEFRNTENLVIEFGAPGGIGYKLQQLLEQKASQCENWLSEWWLNNAYLNYRSPVVVYSNPGMVLPRQSLLSIDDQIKCAATVIVAALDYKRMVDEHQVPQEMMGKIPLDMAQHSMIFGTCRIPGIDVDTLTFAPPPSPNVDAPRHIIIVRNNMFFKVIIYDENGSALCEDDLVKVLNDVVRSSSEVAPAVGVLTAQDRNIWGKTYKQLRQNPLNKQSLVEIQKSLFVVSLDNPNSPSDLNYESVAAMQFIHGGGVKANSGNRWFDKTVQFIIGTGGELGICYEHSPAEGPPIATISDHVMDFCMGERHSAPSRFSGQVKLEKPKRLKFEMDEYVSGAIEKAGSNLEILVKDLQLSCFTFNMFGKNFIKSQKLSPDSFIQVAMQLAFYGIHKELGATYETASTRQFLHGRTEIIRSATSEALEFCKTMSSHNSSFDDKRDSIERAVNAHKQYVMDAVRGFGVDRHLLGLKMVAVEKGFGVPELYLDPGYIRSSHFRISSSQVSARHRSFMCYGPLVPDGYGCCYNPRDDDIIFGISAFNSCNETCADHYSKSLRDSLLDMRTVLLASQKAKL